MEKNLINKKKMGVVFSDLQSTLIGGGLITTWEEYEKECSKVIPLIDLILSNNNYFVIVSTIHHDVMERIARRFSIIYNSIINDNKDKILFFCSECDETKTIQINGIDINLIKEKEDSVDIVISRMTKEGIEISKIIGLGDDEKDLNMLFKIKELGGEVGIVADPSMSFSTCMTYIDFNKLPLEVIIELVVDMEFKIETLKLINKKRDEAIEKQQHMLKYLAESSEYIDLLDRKSKRSLELKEAYIKGTINSDGLQRCLTVAELTNRYYYRYVEGKEMNSNIDDDIQKRIYSIAQNISSSALSTNNNLIDLGFVKALLKE